MIINNIDWSLAYRIESNFRYIISEQEAYGWKIDKDLKQELEEDLIKKITLIQKIADRRIPKLLNVHQEYKKPLKKDGEPSQAVLNWYNDKLDIRNFSLNSIAGPFTYISFKNINLSSVPQKREVLKRLGWVPTEWNFKKDGDGNIIKGIPSKIYSEKWFKKNSWHLPIEYLNSLNEYQPIITGGKICYDKKNRHIKQLITFVRHAKVQHRLSMLQGKLTENLREDGCIGGGGRTVGANTGRMLHRGIVNIPKADKSVFYGAKIRSIFSHRPNYILLGADLSALENRLLGHYTYDIDNGVYAKRLLEECPHDRTAEVLNITRNNAKTINYAMSYGCGTKKLMSILDCSKQEATLKYNDWWNDKKPVTILKDKLVECASARDPKWIKGLDGRKIYVKSEHSILNYLIQSAGSIVNKFITCCVHKEIKRQNIDAHFVLNYHDEIDLEVVNDKKTLDIMKEIIYNSIEECNKYFKFKVPMAMDIKIGNNWAEIH